MHEHICHRCGDVFSSNRDLQRHLDRKNRCDEGPYGCGHCPKRFRHSSSLSRHRLICKGPPVTHASLAVENEQLRTIVAATNARMGSPTSQRTQATQPTQAIQTHVEVNHGTINSIQNNVTVVNVSKEDVSHIRAMSFDELKAELGLTSDADTLARLFKLIHFHPSCPQNVNMLLPHPDSDKLWAYVDGWIQTNANKHIGYTVKGEADKLYSFLNDDWRNNWYYKTILHGPIMQALRDETWCDAKAVLDVVKLAIYENTCRLAQQFKDKGNDVLAIVNNTASGSQTADDSSTQNLRVDTGAFSSMRPDQLRSFPPELIAMFTKQAQAEEAKARVEEAKALARVEEAKAKAEEAKAKAEEAKAVARAEECRVEQLKLRHT